MSIPANATEAPSIPKVWRQLKGNALTFVTIWILFLITLGIDIAFTEWIEQLAINIGGYSKSEAEYISIIVTLLTTTVLFSLVFSLITAVPAIYYATNHCPNLDKIFSIFSHKPLRYILAIPLLFIANLLIVIGLLILSEIHSLPAPLLFLLHPLLSFFFLQIIITLIVFFVSNALLHPLYVHYIFTTNLSMLTCLGKAFSKSFKGARHDFFSFLMYFLIRLLCVLPLFIDLSTVQMLPYIFAILIVWPMTELHIQNYIHHKGLVRARELA